MDSTIPPDRREIGSLEGCLDFKGSNQVRCDEDSMGIIIDLTGMIPATATIAVTAIASKLCFLIDSSSVIDKNY